MWRFELHGPQPEDQAAYFEQCPTCKRWIDARDFGQVLTHEESCGEPVKPG